MDNNTPRFLFTEEREAKKAEASSEAWLGLSQYARRTVITSHRRRRGGVAPHITHQKHQTPHNEKKKNSRGKKNVRTWNNAMSEFNRILLFCFFSLSTLLDVVPTASQPGARSVVVVVVDRGRRLRTGGKQQHDEVLLAFFLSVVCVVCDEFCCR